MYKLIEKRQLFSVEMSDDTTVVCIESPQLVGDVTAELLKLQLFHLIDLARPECCVIDMSVVNRMSSTFVSALLNVRKRLISRDARLRLCGLQIPVQEIYRLLRLEAVFECYATREEAIRGVAAAPSSPRERPSKL